MANHEGPQALSDAVPLAIKKALTVLKDGLVGLNASATAGVDNTLVLLKNALPGTLQVNRPASGRVHPDRQRSAAPHRRDAGRPLARLRLRGARS